MEDDSQSREDTLDRVKATVIIFLSGLAIFFGIMLSTYVVAIALDRWCCCFMSSMAMSQEEIDERRRASPLVKRSGLAGMLRSESTQTLKQFFGKLAYAYQKENIEGVGETTKKKKKAAKQMESIEKVETAHKSEDKSEGNIGNALEPKKDETASSEPKRTAEVKDDEANDNGEEEDKELQELVEMEHTDGTCPICLNEYGV